MGGLNASKATIIKEILRALNYGYCAFVDDVSECFGIDKVETLGLFDKLRIICDFNKDESIALKKSFLWRLNEDAIDALSFILSNDGDKRYVARVLDDCFSRGFPMAREYIVNSLTAAMASKSFIDISTRHNGSYHCAIPMFIVPADKEMILYVKDTVDIVAIKLEDVEELQLVLRDRFTIDLKTVLSVLDGFVKNKTTIALSTTEEIASYICDFWGEDITCKVKASSTETLVVIETYNVETILSKLKLYGNYITVISSGAVKDYLGYFWIMSTVSVGLEYLRHANNTEVLDIWSKVNSARRYIGPHEMQYSTESCDNMDLSVILKNMEDK